MMYPSTLFVALLLALCVRGYQIPQAIVQALKPRGLRIAIPDSPGIQLFGIHVNINQPIQKGDPGRLSKDTLRAKDGLWVAEVPQARVKVGDTINYWIYVQNGGQPHFTDNLSTRITELVNSQTPISPSKQPTKPVCQSNTTTVDGKSSCQGKLVFEDEFNNFNPKHWQHEVKFAGGPDYEFVVYSDSQENSFVSGGKLHVKPTLLSDHNIDIRSGSLQLSGCTAEEGSSLCSRSATGWNILPPVQSALLTTRRAFSFRYGRVEVRAKLPAGDWIFPEIRLLPKSSVYGSDWFESGLIELALARGNVDLQSAGGEDIGARHLDAGCLISRRTAVHREMFGDDERNPWSDSFHNYSVTWTPDKIVFSVDAREIGSMVPPDGGFSSLPTFSQFQNIPWTRGSKMAPFDQEFYLSVGLGVGGFLHFPDDCRSNRRRKPWRNLNPKAMLLFWRDKDHWLPSWDEDSSTLQVESVKVWAL